MRRLARVCAARQAPGSRYSGTNPTLTHLLSARLRGRKAIVQSAAERRRDRKSVQVPDSKQSQYGRIAAPLSATARSAMVCLCGCTDPANRRPSHRTPGEKSMACSSIPLIGLMDATRDAFRLKTVRVCELYMHEHMVRVDVEVCACVHRAQPGSAQAHR